MKSFYPTIYDFQSVIYYLDPYSNYYPTDVLYNFNCTYLSLDRFTDPIYIAAGLTTDYYHGYLMRYKPVNEVNCIKLGDIRISPKNNSVSSYYDFITFTPLPITKYTPDVYPKYELIDRNCMD